MSAGRAGDELKEAVERRTDEAFGRSPWQDPRGNYRAVLRGLRQQDATTFEEAVREYEARIVSRLTDESADPVAAWLGYGCRLAELVGGGRTVRVDDDGRAEALPAEPFSADIIDEPALLLHLPADASAAAFVVASPRELSAAQAAAVALLAGGATALPN